MDKLTKYRKILLVCIIGIFFTGILYGRTDNTLTNQIYLIDMDINSPILKLMQQDSLFDYKNTNVDYVLDFNKQFKLDGNINIISSIKNNSASEYVDFSIYSKDNNNQQIKINWALQNGGNSESMRNESMKKVMDFVLLSREKEVNELILKNNKDLKDFNVAYYEDEKGSHISGYDFTLATKPSSRHRFWRAMGELTFLNGLGVGYYFYRKGDNMVDWEYQPTPSGFKKKITDGWSLDTNNFRTNTLFHVFSGAGYYQVGRSNGYGYAASTLWACAGSLMWEYIGEYREQVSANDMIFTTMCGAILGEGLRSASIYVEKRFGTGIGSTFVAFLLDPLRIFNGYIDSKIGNDFSFNISFINPTQAIIESRARGKLR